ncbi:hypothetical protein B0H14DRAFT_2633625 [Mycena olivaceomarginata]|nr:hypothetical protein B0H14DRAFT_2633625 [Mycena olivaceomarginata]
MHSTVPSRNADHKQRVVAKTIVPCGYRIPLLWLGKGAVGLFEAITHNREEAWDNLKWDVLHLARDGWGLGMSLYGTFIGSLGTGSTRMIFCSGAGCKKLSAGIRSFAITEAELKDGITAEQFMRGLVFDREKGTFDWTERDGTLGAVAPTPAPAPSDAPTENGLNPRAGRAAPPSEQMDGMRHAQEDGEAASAQGPVPAVVVQPETMPITPDQQPTLTALAPAVHCSRHRGSPPADSDDVSVVAPLTVDVDSAAESSSATDARPTNVVDAEATPPNDSDDIAIVAPLTVDVNSAAESSSATDARPPNVVDAEAAPPNDSDDIAAMAPFTVDVDSAAESSSATDAPPTSAVDVEATPPMDTDDIAVATVLASAVVPVAVNVDSTAEPSSATDTPPASAVDAAAATNSNDIAVEVSSTFDSHASGENRAVDLAQRVISRRDLPHRTSFSSAAHAKPLCWSTRDLERFIPLLPSSSELPQRILNQISMNLTQTRDQIRECHAVLRAHGCIADPPSTSDIGLCLKALERHFEKA